MGLLASAVGGLGEGLMVAGKQFGDYLSRSNLQAEAAAIQKARDEIIEGYARGREERGEQAMIRAEDRKRAPYQRASERTQALLNSPVYDEATDSVSPRRRSEAEEARIRAGAYEAEGLPEVSSTLRREALDHDRLAADRAERHLDRGERAQDLASRERYQNAQLAISKAQLDAAKGGFTLQPLADGRIAKIYKDDRPVDYLRDPSTNEALSGGKDISAATKLLVEVNKSIIAANEKRMADFNLSPQEKAGINEESLRLKAEINSLLFGKALVPPPNPARTGWYSTSKEVYVAGQKIGTAATETEARKMAEKHMAATGGTVGLLGSDVSEPHLAWQNYVKQRRGGVYIDAPARSPFAVFNGRTFANREEALRELGAFAGSMD